RREDDERSFVETVEQYALGVPAYRDAESPFAPTLFAPGDPFFSAVDDSPLLSDAMLAEVKAHPEQYALVEVQATALYAHLALLAQEDDEASAADVALTA
ncbi:MAG: hypothetical protein M3R61_00375, partial [Chloroflexota bacterium]|nr:hypothetical protein [Chloroflexota bacterium]